MKYDLRKLQLTLDTIVSKYNINEDDDVFHPIELDIDGMDKHEKIVYSSKLCEDKNCARILTGTLQTPDDFMIRILALGVLNSKQQYYIDMIK